MPPLRNVRFQVIAVLPCLLHCSVAHTNLRQSSAKGVAPENDFEYKPGELWQKTGEAPARNVQQQSEVAITKREVPPVRSWQDMKVLIYVASKYEERIVDNCIANVNHLRSEGLDFDLLIGHYDEQKPRWLLRNLTWYGENVRWGVNAPGFKVHLLSKIRSEGLAGSLQLADYDWVWLLDEDLRLNWTRPARLFRDIAASNALIVGPSFVQMTPEDNVNAEPGVQSEEPQFEMPYYPMNVPQWDKQYRYTPLVEIIMPIVRPQVLETFFDCDGCLPPFNSDWGLDHVWCNFAASHFVVDPSKVCAVVDHTGPVVHLNYGSTRVDAIQDGVKSEGAKANKYLKDMFGEDFARDHLHVNAAWDGYDEAPAELRAVIRQAR